MARSRISSLNFLGAGTIATFPWDQNLHPTRGASAGVDPAAVVEPINRARTERDAARACLAHPEQQPEVFTEAQVGAMVDELGDVGAAIDRARPDRLASLYRELDIGVRYEPPEFGRSATVTMRVADECVRGGTRPRIRGTPAPGRGSCVRRYPADARGARRNRARHALGTRIDLTLTATTAPSTPLARVLAEAKRIDNDDLLTAMNDQLVERYLLPMSLSHGLFLAYWIRPDQRPANWSRTRAADVLELRSQLADQADLVRRTHGIEIAVYVLDVSHL